MSLSSILELCEEHMSEGDYLIAANILKNVHNTKPVDNDLRRTYTLDSPIKIIKLDRDMDEEGVIEFVIKEVIQTRAYRSCAWNIEKIKCNIYGNDMILSWSKFCKLLDNYLKMNLYINFKVTNWWFNVSHTFSFSDYSKFIIQQHDEVHDESDMSEAWIYAEYIIHVTQRLKECIEITSSE
jgi:hypothetical protein